METNQKKWAAEEWETSDHFLLTVRSLVGFMMGTLECFPVTCANGVTYDKRKQCLYDKEPDGLLSTCRDASHLIKCEPFTCPESYVKCPGSFCLAVHLVCDGKPDCQNGEDEVQCGKPPCPGLFRCHEIGNCVPLSQVCDGYYQCHHKDDELLCNVTCPNGCSCISLAYMCSAAGFAAVPSQVSGQARILDLSSNEIDMNITHWHYHYLYSLNLSTNGISLIQPGTFNMLETLLFLDLSSNKLSILRNGTFAGLGKLLNLTIHTNPIIEIHSGAFLGLAHLPSLSLIRTEVQVINSGSFQGLIELQKLNISNNKIETMEKAAFHDVNFIKVLVINNNFIKKYTRDTFEELSSLEYLESDEYAFCCFVSLNKEHCFPQADELSSCSDLMSNNILRWFLWILGIMALVGNGFVIVWRSVSKLSSSVPGFLVTNLAISDILMGAYMISIATADVIYRGQYIENAEQWKNGWVCSILGCISAISSEASVLILCVISADRLKNIVFPFTGGEFDLFHAKVVMGVTWVMAVLFAVIPLLPLSYFDGKFYSRSAVCVSLHITLEKPPGWEYSVAIFHVLNFIAFVFILLVYGGIYVYFKKTGKAAGRGTRNVEATLARKMTLVVMTDFCCWIPINIMGLLALGGTAIPGQIYAWAVVFILPVNSALNPVIYTFNALQLRGKKLNAPNRMKMKSMKVSLWYEDTATTGQGLHQFLSQNGVLSLELVHKLGVKIAGCIACLHKDGMTVGVDINPVVVLVKQTKDDIAVGLNVYPLEAEAGSPHKAEDMAEYGKLISHLLQVYGAHQKTRY